MATSAKKVLKIDAYGKVSEQFESATDAAKSVGVTPQAISNACRYGIKVKGTRWIYART